MGGGGCLCVCVGGGGCLCVGGGGKMQSRK